MSWYIQIRATVHPPTQPGHAETLTYRQVAYPDEQGIGEGHALCNHEHETPLQASRCPDTLNRLCEVIGRHAPGCPHDEQSKHLALAQKGYEAWCGVMSADRTSIYGGYLPWDELGTRAHRAWRAAAVAIREQ